MPRPTNACSRWALVLAGGSGLRLSRWTTGRDGAPVPKQFCLFAGRTLLAAALARADAHTTRARTVAVVTAEHRRYWEPDLVPVLADANIAVQPCNRGTAAGILFPLLRILRRDPAASVLILPSDHFVADERRLASELSRALALAGEGGGRVLLLGMTPERVEDGLGWITPRGAGRLEGIRAFVEKPAPEQARAALEAGALVNSFLLAADGGALLDLFERAAPDLVEALRGLENRDATITDYERLPKLDFSRDVVERSIDDPRLQVLRVPPCGWSDLGTPDRLGAATQKQLGARHHSSAGSRLGHRPDLGRLFVSEAM